MQVQRGDQPPLPTNGNSSVACSMPKVLHARAECVKVVIDFDLAFLVPMTISGLHTHTIPMFEGYSENVAPCPVSFCVAKIGCAWKQTYRHRILLHPHSPREEALFPKVPSSNENYSNHGTSALNTSGPKRKYKKNIYLLQVHFNNCHVQYLSLLLPCHNYLWIHVPYKYASVVQKAIKDSSISLLPAHAKKNYSPTSPQHSNPSPVAFRPRTLSAWNQKTTEDGHNTHLSDAA